MTGYTKLFGSLIHSTVWQKEPHIKLVWVTMLALVDKDGIVEASVPGLAKAAGVTLEQAEDALASFLAPDPYSRSKEAEGRRIEVIDGGWWLINHRKYRELMANDERRERNAERMRTVRERARSFEPVREVSHTDQIQIRSDPKAEQSRGAALELEGPEEQTGVRHVSSRPPPPSEPSEAAAPPSVRAADDLRKPVGQGASASDDLAAYIRGKPKLADLDVEDLADFASRMHDPGNVPMGMIREAIDDANDKSERAEQRHVRHARVIGFIKQAKTKPRKPDPKPPAQVEADDSEAVARIRRMPKRVTAQSVPLVGAGREAALEAMAKFANKEK